MQIASVSYSKWGGKKPSKARRKGNAVTLPARGLVLVQGPNGSGKSTIIEAVAWALFNSSLRGARPPEDAHAIVTVRDGLSVNRRQRVILTTPADIPPDERPATTLAAHVVLGVPDTWATVSKAYEWLRPFTGDFDVWRRTCVFSSADAALLSTATDATRKRLLEDLLGLAVFDAAQDRAAAALREAISNETAKRQEVVNLTNRLTSAAEALRKAEERAALEYPPLADGTELQPPSEQDMSAAEASATEAARLRQETDARLRAALSAAGGAQATATAQEMLLKRLVNQKECPTCTQPIPNELRARVRRSAELAVAEAQAAREAHGVDALRDQVEELAEEAQAAQRKVSRLQAEAQAAARDKAHRARHAQAHARIEQARAEADATLQQLRAQRDQSHVEAVQAQAELAVAKAVSAVFGLRGVRAHVLGTALESLTTLANEWLRMMPLGGIYAGIRLQADPESGRVELSVLPGERLEGIPYWGDGQYAACSAGQRRRIDIALMLALGEVAGALHGSAPGTLFFDEVFDALDPEGVQGAVDVLTELAKERCVVVITHDAELRDHLRDQAHTVVSLGHDDWEAD